MEFLQRIGVSSTQAFVEATHTVTFRMQAEMWLKSLGERKRNPLVWTTIDNRRYALDKWIHPYFEGARVADVTNRSLRDFVGHVSHLKPSTIRDYVNIVKDVVASAIDENGEAIFQRKWNEEFIDAPLVRKQHQPTVDEQGVSGIVEAAVGQYRTLYALLSGCGPLRVGEALGLEIPNISADCRTLRICQNAKRGKLSPKLKTAAGEREVDLCQDLSSLLKDFIGSRRTGLLFSTITGRQLLQSNTLQDSLHPILWSLSLPKGGFNMFRRFRLTHVAKTECPEFLRHFWSGHAAKHVSERYIKLLNDRDFRLMWAERIGMGFEIRDSRTANEKGIHLVA
jgi:integrase